MTLLAVVKSFVILLSSVSIAGNTLVCFIILGSVPMRTTMNYLLLNLAILDILTGLLALPVVTIFSSFSTGPIDHSGVNHTLSSSSMVGDLVCKIRPLFWLSGSVSPLFLVVIAYERFIVVTRPLNTICGISDRKLCIIIAGCWGLGSALQVPDLVAVSYHGDGMCSYGAEDSWFSREWFAGVLTVVIFVVPSTVIVILYVKVVRCLTSGSEQIGLQAVAKTARDKRYMRITKMIIIITLIFIICWGFCYISFLVEQLVDVPYSDILLHTKHLMMCVNSCANPFIYFIFFRSFREKIQKMTMACLCWRRKDYKVNVHNKALRTIGTENMALSCVYITRET
ncbi:neuropeptide FF receptor 1-like [Nematostella vectensis]|uniref:neuropeptide FF receptor 1-like n=1 Tax=Nematostella vectensis TaxID=45351 RepID=UPI0020776A56|nr:neuropeptide FF receptor 1-like [Nematostella vectensis]